MEYYAHVKENQKQTVKEHLEGVAEKASSYSVDMMKSIVYTVGIAHDIGKYSQAFQDRLNGSKEKYEHSICGAIEISKVAQKGLQEQIAYMLEYCIAGHHSGLPDGGTKYDDKDSNTLQGRMKRNENYKDKSDYSAYKSDVELLFPDINEVVTEIQKSTSKTEIIEKYAFFTRYIFSCLTDADFIDTENFCSPDIDRELNCNFEKVEELLNEKFSQFKLETDLQKARSRLQEQALENSNNNSNISILNMPTGSGKTLCSLKIALSKLRNSNNKKRIIYVIPYTSIIEQTAEVFNGIFGEYADILQHHSNYSYEELAEDDTTAQKLRLSSENWNAPIIITTSVQFFQSLYHYRGSKLRKLHNMADSIIIFDEIHMLPIEMLQPCLRGIGFITKYLNSEAVFLSATMPDYSILFEKFLPENSVNKLISDTKDFLYFQKCKYINLGKTDIETVVEKTQNYKNSLIIVNSRKSAREVFNLISGKKYHLSTYMTPCSRSKVINEIRQCLENGEKITVVSTSLVEAGVDLDFEAVFRQLTGLDSILQSGGRCNREGRNISGDVYIFETSENIQGEIQQRSSIVKDMLLNNEDISSLKNIEEYYHRLFNFNDNIIQEKSIAKDTPNGNLNCIPFRTYAENFKFIKDDTIGIVINNCEETETLISKISNLQYGEKKIKRQLQQYTVQLKISGEFDKALSRGLINDTGCGVYVLSNNDYYDSEIGLNLDYQSVNILD